MLTDSIYKNLGRSHKGDRKRLPGLQAGTIEIIAGYGPEQLKKIYERDSIHYLMREISAWKKLGKHTVVQTIKNIIKERKEAYK